MTDNESYVEGTKQVRVALSLKIGDLKNSECTKKRLLDFELFLFEVSLVTRQTMDYSFTNTTIKH